ncbi:hypothetical protein B0T26DRAFT_825247 [Lasiosphaeria miniovina]|uniref:Transcription factor CBF/NF-Y/archaeal histone domain-containing protein n=1 Tax=Lasiosphaeria miniovina TaxID=1954250 RepID=A0AA40AU56_9PEZI|nr:uncharacterized protein B0T26DRAFT_825247 [Lasiosphaeria miniovina]KAK0722072.1 hypothetical protein B0T26DRAFT_825247 [Lasiosphaeria miniovina]
MPYNTTAIPPRKEVTGQAQLPLTRVKKIIAVDPDIAICSNNAAFVITLATEMFIQHLASEAQNMAKMERKPRRNIQYKDMVTHHDNLEFLEDVIPKTTTYKQIKVQAAATRAKLKGDKAAAAAAAAAAAGTGTGTGTSKHKGINGSVSSSKTNGVSSRRRVLSLDADPSAQLELEMRQAHSAARDEDVDMAD